MKNQTEQGRRNGHGVMFKKGEGRSFKEVLSRTQKWREVSDSMSKYMF